MGGQGSQLYPVFKEKLSVFLTCKNTFINLRSSFLSFCFICKCKNVFYYISLFTFAIKSDFCQRNKLGDIYCLGSCLVGSYEVWEKEFKKTPHSPKNKKEGKNLAKAEIKIDNTRSLNFYLKRYHSKMTYSELGQDKKF